MFAVTVPYAKRVPPEEEFHRFQPTAVAAAVAVRSLAAFKFVTLICGELAAAAVSVIRDRHGPSKADCVVGDCVANDIQRVAGLVAAAPPKTQSRTSFLPSGVKGIRPS